MKIDFEMSLFDGGFYGIKSGKQTVEGRVFDLKRQSVEVDNIIRFYHLPERKEFFDVLVVEVLKYDSFREMFEALGGGVFGCDDDCLVEDFVGAYRKYYSEEKEKEFGVLGIRIEVGR